jgi:hypothetical protein
MKTNKYICVSYTPQLLGKPGELIENKDNIMAMAKKLDEINANVIGCAWTEKDGLISPIFVVENAKAVYDHLMIWCEEKPEEWFSLTIKKHKDGKRYWVVLWPDISKSIERFKIGQVMFNETFINDKDITILCKPWRFISKDSGMYEVLKDKVGNKAFFGFLDVNDVPNTLVGKRDFQLDAEPLFIGPIQVKDNDVESIIHD